MRKPPAKQTEVKPANPFGSGKATSPVVEETAPAYLPKINWEKGLSRYMSGGLNISRGSMDSEFPFGAGAIADDAYSDISPFQRMGPFVDGKIGPVPNTRMFPDKYAIEKVKRFFFQQPELVAKAGGVKARKKNPHDAAEQEADRSVTYNHLKSGVTKTPNPAGASADDIYETLSEQLKQIFGYSPGDVASKRRTLEQILSEQAPERQMAGLPDPESLPGAFAIGQALAAFLRGDGLGAAAEAYTAPMGIEQQRLDQEYALGREDYNTSIESALKQLGIVMDTQQEMSRYAQNFVDNKSREAIASGRNETAREIAATREQGANRRAEVISTNKQVADLFDMLGNTLDPNQRASIIGNINRIRPGTLDPSLANVQDPALLGQKFDAARKQVLAESQKEVTEVQNAFVRAKTELTKSINALRKLDAKNYAKLIALKERRLEIMDRALTQDWSKFSAGQNFDGWKAMLDFMEGSGRDSHYEMLRDEVDEAREAYDAVVDETKDVLEKLTSKPDEKKAAQARRDQAKETYDNARAAAKEYRDNELGKGKQAPLDPSRLQGAPGFIGPNSNQPPISGAIDPNNKYKD